MVYRLISRRSRRGRAGKQSRACEPAGASPPGSRRVPVALKLAYGIATPAIAAVYLGAYGPANFLWLSDIALGLTTAAVLGEAPLPASVAAVGVLPLELAWNADFLSGGRLGLAGYMFDAKLSRGLRALSLFHVALPPTLFWLLRRLGYDRRAFAVQSAVTLSVLPLCYALTDPAKNINWAFGPGEHPQRRLPPLLYLGLTMAAFVGLAHWPTHRVLARLFPAAPARPRQFR